ncbi:hypothetical protein SteCoe_24105 [Stentor coeruleus]|uniref:RING-type domain-containing protein n=1 Tax=Stentor coeruleus TaxID=5963 RepID=A0A1R2BIE8_9CILI|nr:hypothetical protein SteCoe_24105 [Stentor coeruleus]
MSLTSEAMLSLLKLLIKNTDKKALRSSPNFNTLVQLYQQIYSIRFLLPFPSKVTEELNELFTCSYCLSQQATIFLKCSHNLCEDCCNLFIQKHQEKSKKQHIDLKCRICKTRINLSKYNHLIDKSQSQGNKIGCAGCKEIKCSGDFYNNQNCSKLCKICVWKYVTEGVEKCKMSGVRIKYKDFEADDSCSECLNPLTSLTAIYVCNNHPYCSFCAKVMISDVMCKKCNEPINDGYYKIALASLNMKCMFCSKIKEVDLFVKKFCCVKKICIECQIGFNMKKCRGCQETLDLKFYV